MLWSKKFERHGSCRSLAVGAVNLHVHFLATIGDCKSSTVVFFIDQCLAQTGLAIETCVHGQTDEKTFASMIASILFFFHFILVAH
jgi:hypothetical protein